MTCPHDRGNSDQGNSSGGNSDPASQLFSRRGVVVALASATVLCVDTPVGLAFAPSEDQVFMRLALDEARRGDPPFGAVIVRDDKVIARGRDLGKVHDDPTAHSEMMAIAAAWMNVPARRCAAARFTRPVSRARCVWARSCGAMSGGSFSPRP